MVTIRLVIESTLEMLRLSLPETSFESFELGTTVTPFDGDVVVVVVVVVDVVVDVVVGDVVVVTALKVVDVLEFGEAELPAPSHAFGVPKTTGVAPIGAATRTFPAPSMLMLKYVLVGNDWR